MDLFQEEKNKQSKHNSNLNDFDISPVIKEKSPHSFFLPFLQMKRSMSSIRSDLSSLGDASTANLFLLSTVSELHPLCEEKNYTDLVSSRGNWRKSCLPFYEEFFEPLCKYETVSESEPVSESVYEAPKFSDEKVSDMKSKPTKTKKGIHWINCYFYGFYMNIDELNRYNLSVEETSSSPKRAKTTRTEYLRVKKDPTDDGRQCFPNMNYSCSQS
tara:strand:- start:487 stop:1131 length:645 start_codon:yes stop_codon:yes gene_type:complete